jgi:hypothetical protein
MSTAFEKHYRVKELAELWGFAENAIIRLLRDEPGVLRLDGLGFKRKYQTLSIPESVALQVHERIANNSIIRVFPSTSPRGVIRFCDLDRGTAQRSAKTKREPNKLGDCFRLVYPLHSGHE